MRSVCFLVYWLCFVAVVKVRLSPGSNRDTTTLLSIIGDFSYPPVVAESWKGNDPCQDWYGIICRGGQISAITFIAMNLTGIISPRFADLTSLSVIDLSHNRLTGTIPFELTSLNMTSLDLSYNQLHGKVPQFRKTVLNTEGNPEIETNNTQVTSQTGNKKSAVVLGIFIGILVVGVLLVGGCIAFYLFMKMERSNRQPEPNEASAHTQQSSEHNEILEAENIVIPMQILRDVTDDFRDRNIVGRGGFGAVYKGKLRDGIEVAVKRMNPSFVGGKGIDQFRSEVSVLTRVYHRNIVVLHGYCLERDERLLVYQYMPQSTLSMHLFDWKDEGLQPVDWSRRLLVALDVARGVEHLHTLVRQGQSYIHRDLKCSNILLGEDMRAKVYDFGLVRSTEEGRESIMTKCVGTAGYIAPKYASTGRISRKSDIYSFGVILMALIIGKRAIDETRSEVDTHIVVWFSKKFSEKDFIDETIAYNEETRRSIEEVAELAIQCCAKEPEQRLEMTHAVTALGLIIEPWKPPEIKDDDVDTTSLLESLTERIKRCKHDIEASSSGT